MRIAVEVNVIVDGEKQHLTTLEFVSQVASVQRKIKLTRRETEVLGQIELSNKEIASNLGVCVRTVKHHVSTLLKKYDVDGRMGLIMRARSVA